jgi:hypothetical protein
MKLQRCRTHMGMKWHDSHGLYFIYFAETGQYKVILAVLRVDTSCFEST